MERRTAWLVTGIAVASFVVAFYAMLGRELYDSVDWAVSRTQPLRTVPELFGKGWNADGGPVFEAVEDAEGARRVLGSNPVLPYAA